MANILSVANPKEMARYGGPSSLHAVYPCVDNGDCGDRTFDGIEEIDTVDTYRALTGVKLGGVEAVGGNDLAASDVDAAIAVSAIGSEVVARDEIDPDALKAADMMSFADTLAIPADGTHLDDINKNDAAAKAGSTTSRHPVVEMLLGKRGFCDSLRPKICKMFCHGHHKCTGHQWVDHPDKSRGDQNVGYDSSDEVYR